MGEAPVPGGDKSLAFESVIAFEDSFDALYGLELIEPGLDDTGILRGRVRVRPELLGAEGRLHGGVPAAIAESLASNGTALITMQQGLIPSGLSNDTTVTAAVGTGATLQAEAVLLSGVDDFWVWSVELRDDAGTLCAFSRVTIAVRPRRP